MKGHFVLRHRVVAAGVCLILIGVLMTSLVWVVNRASPPAAGTSPASGQAAVMAGSQPAPFDPAAAERAVAQAWEKARDAGAYSFATQLTQITYPALSLSNAGRGPQRSELNLSGTIDQPARMLEFRMWQPGADGSAGPGSGVEARIEGDRAMVRQDGGEWQEVEDFSSTFAPDNDPLSFLAGIKDIGQCGLQARAPTAGQTEAAALTPTSAELACYRFNVDGPALAGYLRERLERQMAKAGGLPAGVSLDISSSVKDVTGYGELWVDGRGLPLRLAMHLAFPEESDGSRAEADVQTEFSGYPEEAVATAPELDSDPVAGAAAVLGLDEPSLPGRAAQAAGQAGVVACVVGAMVLLVIHRRSRRMYLVAAVAIILSMVVVPLLQSEQVAAFYERQAAASQDLISLAAAGQGVDVQSAQEQEAAGQPPAWDPEQDPLAQPDRALAQAGPVAPESVAGGASSPAVAASPPGAGLLVLPPSALSACDQDRSDDPDGDGLNDYQECVYGTASTVADTEGDGLSDDQELNKLGTNPILADSDGDGLSDKIEVQGITLGSKTWYPDPNNADTNNDGLVDLAECPKLVDATKGCDGDGDNIPNFVEDDNDGDGVPDGVDLSPDSWADKGGLRNTAATSPTAFDGTSSNVFQLSVSGLADGWPVLVDVQLRPVEAAHLGYAMNVLDWPVDVDANIQHGKNTTFATSDNPDIANPDDQAGANGDMRLVPLLEIVMIGDEIPLKVTALAPKVRVGSGTAVSSTVTLSPGSNAADTQLTFLAGATLAVYAGTCPASGLPSGTPLKTFTGGSGTWTGMKVVDLADGNHAAVVTVGTTSACATLPDAVVGKYTGKMVDTSALEPYGITVKDGYGTEPKAVVAYVPLDVIPDETGGGKVAFQARMPFWTGTNSHWNAPVQMRVVWLVQVITDRCAEGSDTWEQYQAKNRNADRTQYNQYVAAYCAAHRTMDEIQVVQTYDESWYLTGLSVQEARGLDVAVAYPKPSATTYSDDALWTLSWGLAQQFVPGRDCENPLLGICQGDGKRDLAVSLTDHSNNTVANSTIEVRFKEGAPVGQDRWGIAQDALRVKTYRFAHQDYVGYLASTITPAILSEYTNHAQTPTLLFAYEERSRLGNLDVASMAAGTASMSMDMSDTTAKPHPVRTVTGISWAPFRYNSTKSAWESHSLADYWTALETDLTARFTALIAGDSPATRKGRVAAAHSYAIVMTSGVSSVVCTPGGSDCSKAAAQGASNVEITNATAATGMKSGLNHASMQVLAEQLKAKKQLRTNDVAFDQSRNAQTALLQENIVAMTNGASWDAVSHPEADLFASLGGELLSPTASSWLAVWTGGSPAGVTGGLLAGPAAMTLAVHVKGRTQTRLLGDEIKYYVKQTASAAAKIASIAKTVYDLVQAGKGAGGVANAISANIGFSQNMQTKGAVLGAVMVGVQIAASWAKFALAVGFGMLAPGSMAFDDAVASLVAKSVVTVVLFVVFKVLGPIGSIIEAVIASINIYAAMLCHAFVSDEEMQTEEWTDWVCGGITGFLENFAKALIYSGTIMVDMNPDADRGAPYYPRLNLSGFNPIPGNQGMVQGGSINYSLAVTNTLALADVPIRLHEASWAWQFSADTLRQSTFGYGLQSQKTPLHGPLSLGSMWYSWLKIQGKDAWYYKTTVASKTGFTLGGAGINQPAGGVYLSEAYAVPEQECWGLALWKVCSIETEKGTNHYDLGADLIYDILPATLTGFYGLAAKGAGYALSWGQQGNVRFPALYDADGDGLTAASDPDDRKWDADGDGLSDVYELDNGSRPDAIDTDDDGLTDRQEVLFGTNAWMADTDGDGLLDCQEVTHQVISTGDGTAQAVCGGLGAWSGGWDIGYKLPDGTQKTTHVTSNPLAYDTDEDGLSDSREKLYGYNPRAYSVLNVLSLKSTVSETGQPVSDGFVVPNQALSYTGTVKNALDSRHATGLLWTAPSDFFQSAVAAQAFTLEEEQQTSMTGNVSVVASDSGTYSLTQVAGALLVDPKLVSQDALLWLRFDDAAGSAVFADSSHQTPLHDGSCSGTCALDTIGGRIGGALNLAGTGYVTSTATIPSGPYGVSFWLKTTATTGGLFGSELTGRAVITLEAGKICAQIPGDIKRCSLFTYNDGNWHQVVHTDAGSGAGRQQLYVDGTLVASGGSLTTSWVSQAGVVIGGRSGGASLNGYIDDVRLFDGVISPARSKQIASEPIFHMDFDDTSAWKDASSYQNSIVTFGEKSPTHISSGLSKAGARFTEWGMLVAQPSRHLDLSQGRFTLSVWIKPAASREGLILQSITSNTRIVETSSVGISQHGKQIEFFISNFDSVVFEDFYSSADVLTLNEWNHVVLAQDTLPGDMAQARLYVNGLLAETFAPYSYRPSSRRDWQLHLGNNDSDSAFVGDMDEVQVFAEPLGADDVWKLYLPGATALHLKLDEAPGLKEFVDAGLSRVKASCTGTGCPTTGVAGRLDRAALFDGVDDYVSSPLNVSETAYGLSLWFKTSCADCGIYSVVNGTHGASGADRLVWLSGGNVYARVWNNETIQTSGTNYADGQWHHLVHTFGGTEGGQKIYLDGALAASGTKYISDFSTQAGIEVGYAADAGHDFFSGLIDDVQVFQMALAPGHAARMYATAPVLHLRFEEAYGATQFADNADGARVVSCTQDPTCPASGTCTCPLTGEGAKGQVGLAAQFDGTNDYVNAGNGINLANASFSVAFWARRDAVGGTHIAISQGTKATNTLLHIGFRDSNVFTCSFYNNDLDTPNPYTDTDWHHWACTYDARNKIRTIYRDGVKVAQDHPTADFQGSGDLYAGQYVQVGSYFKGSLDELRIYNRALTDVEVRDQWSYEYSWFEDRQSQDITVDNDDPTAEVLLDAGSRLARQPIVVGLAAGDETSGVDQVDLGVKQGAGTIAWTAAARCTDENNQPEGAWCATFNPPAEGSYTLYGRATDRVGHLGPQSADLAVYVDDTAPALTLDQTEGQLLNVQQSTVKPNTWLVRLSGTATDAGSGVPGDGVRVTLRQMGDPERKALGEAGQTATLTAGGAWSLDYTFATPDADGRYEVEVEAVDEVSRLAGLESTQVTRHTTKVTRNVVLDAGAPQVLLDRQQAIAGEQLGPSVTSLGGAASDRPAELQVELIAVTGAELTHVRLSCQYAGTSSWYTLFDLPAGSLAAGDTRAWTGEIQQGSSCQAELSTTGASGGVSGSVKVCGEPVTGWDGSYSGTMPFVVNSGSCMGSGPLLLHLPFDTSPATDGTILPDISGWNHNGTLHTGDAANKAVTGRVGTYALHLDGTDDYVNAGSGIDLRDTSFTVAFWAQRDTATSGDFALGQGTAGTNTLLHIGFRADGLFTCSFYGNDQDTYNMYTDTGWHHWACTYDVATGNRTIYRDGVSVPLASQVGSGTYQGSGDLYVGRYGTGSNSFGGSLDDVRIYPRALSGDEVGDLYWGSGQTAGVYGVQGVDVAFTPVLPGSAFFNEVPWTNEVLHLPFEDTPDRNGDLVLRDASGAGLDSNKCTGDVCPLMGQASPSGSAGLFDGVNDTVSIPDSASFDAIETNDKVTIAAWVNINAWYAGWFPVVDKYEGTGDMGWGFQIHSTNGLNFLSGTASAPACVLVPPLHQWVHLAVTYDRSTAKIQYYVNGVQQCEQSFSSDIKDTSGEPLYLGYNPSGGDEYSNGLLDEVRIFGRALTAAEIEALYTGSGPVLTLSFEEPWATDGASLPDASGWEHNGTLHTSDTANKAVTGQVGTYALSFDGTDDYVNAGSGINLANRSFSVAFWARRDAAGRYEFAFSQGTAATDNLLHIGFRSTNNFTCAFYGNHDLDTPGAYTDTGWHHWACTFDKGANGNTRTIYRDGVEVTHDHPTYTFQGSGDVYLGRVSTGGYQFKGSLDDLRIYPRALPALEVADLYHAGWQAAGLAAGGAGAESTSWTASVPSGPGTTTTPSGLEGSYQVEMRGVDVAGHAEAATGSGVLWRGEVDNLPPRVTLTRASVVGGKYQYTTVAEDYDLVDPTVIANTWAFTSPCGADVASTFTKVNFQSPWYVGQTDTQKLFKLTAVCTTDNASAQATVCDSFGNCNTCDSAGSCAASVTATPSLETLLAGAEAASPSALKAGKLLAKPGPALFEISAVDIVTASQYYEPRIIELSGLVTSLVPPGAGEHDLASVQVAIGGETGLAILSLPAAQRPYTVTWTFPWRLPLSSELPDGVQYTAIITATNLAGRTKAIHHTLTADVVLPTPATLTLAANGQPVEPGAVIREPNAALALTWTPSSDGSGLDPYLAAWRFQDTYTTTMQTSFHDPAGPLAAYATAGEAQRVTMGLGSRDQLGNARRQAFGSVIVDGPLTPDYIAFSPEAEEDLTGSTCTLLGADRRIARRERSRSTMAEQRLYGTWDHQALRLAWTGANWSADGDLFIYLDTREGGTTQTFTPYTVSISGTQVTLPAGLEADTLIWVQDPGTASLLRWDGSAWAQQAGLTADQYRFDAALNGGQADLYLPFGLLGIAQGGTLGLLAFATEEPAPDSGLKLWATAPLANPVNSDRVSLWSGLAPAGITMPLLRAYRWAALGDGVCPNGTGQPNDAALDISVESDPPGASISGLAGGLFWVRDPGDLLSAPAAEPGFAFLRAAHPPIPDGQVINYTVNYRNEGSHTLEGAWLVVSTRGAMQPQTDTITLGDIPPGGEGTVTFQRTADRSQSPYGLAAVVGRLYAAGSGEDMPPLEWLVAIHRVDQGAPEEMDLEQPELVMGPAAGRLGGFARDESGISQVEIEISSPNGAITTVTCEVQDQDTGGWSCPWDGTALNGGVRPADGDLFTVRLRATDRLGYTSPWSPARTIRVDALPPAVTLGISPGYLVRGNTLPLMGQSLDNTAVGGVTLCLEDTCRTADLLNAGARASGWSCWLMAPGAMDYVTKTLTVQAADRLGNVMTQTLSLPVTFDNVPPVLNAGQVTAWAPLGSEETVLSGDVSDGGPELKVSVRVQPPQSDVFRLSTARDGTAWWFDLPATMVGQYTLWVDAEDLAENVTTAGPYTVTVTCTDAAPLVAGFSAEPVAGQPLSLTLTIAISNAGPEGLPAGLPVLVSDGISYTRRVSTSVPLAAGASEALSLGWAPDRPGDYQIGVTPGNGAVLPNGPLCFAPGAQFFSVRAQALYAGWTLVGPRVNPSNTAVEAVQRGIDGPYTAILGYDGGLLAYYPDNPGGSTLTAVDALHGYWVQTPTAATWWMAGQVLPEDQPLPLAAGWNLAGYLPRQPLTVTVALEGIAGQYGAVLGFDRTAATYYPDLDASYNTLVRMAPGYGYWISATQAVTLTYPVATISNTLPLSATQMARERRDAIVAAEWQAGVQPTYEWANFYGEASLPDGTPIPAGTLVVAVDPDGIICGATAVWQPGQFGLLACYVDDPATEADEGAVPGDTIQLFVSSDGTQPDGQPIGTGVWTAHGSRWEIGQEVQPVVDLTIAKAVVPQAALPGATVTYTLSYFNAGNVLAQGVVLSDVLPAEIVATGYTYSGAVITPTASSEPFVWQVADLEPGAGGIITVTAVLSPALTGPLTITNTATISAPLEAQPENNVAQAVLQVIVPQPTVDLAITKEVVPQEALPGATITYTLHYWNAGDASAQGVVINDGVPAEIAVTGVTYSGAEITPVDGEDLAWQVADLEPGAGGIITVTAVLSPALTGPLEVTNTATITAPLEAQPQDNMAMAVLQVSEVQGLPAVVDLVLTKAVVPQAALPGAAITYTLTYWNAGDAVAQGVVINDAVPAEIAVTGVAYSGAEITPVDGGQDLAWQVADLEPGVGGIITVTAVLSPALTGPLDVTNTAIITAPGEVQPEDNMAQAIVQVIQGLAWLWRLLVHGPL